MNAETIEQLETIADRIEQNAAVLKGPMRPFQLVAHREIESDIARLRIIAAGERVAQEPEGL